LVVGRSEERSSLEHSVQDLSGTVGGVDVSPTTNGKFYLVLPVVEIELGVQYQIHSDWGNPFVRAGIVNQTYFGAGNAASREGNLSLFGAQVSLGATF